MFNLFKSGNIKEPLNKSARQYFEQNMQWLAEQFPEPTLAERKIFTPTKIDIPIKWTVSEESAIAAMHIVADAMQIDRDEVELHFFDDNLREINMGTSVIFIENDPQQITPAGLYHHKNEHGKYEISISRGLLDKPQDTIGVLAHELAHVKLLGHKELDFNDEHLTDLTTVFFGFGVFNANAAFQFNKTTDRWSYKNQGYLKQEDWAYSMAILAFMRNEEAPTWSGYLNKTIKKDFENSLNYILQNKASIFQYD